VSTHGAASGSVAIAGISWQGAVLIVAIVVTCELLLGPIGK
jgi:hypothetical protein